MSRKARIVNGTAVVGLCITMAVTGCSSSSSGSAASTSASAKATTSQASTAAGSTSPAAPASSPATSKSQASPAAQKYEGLTAPIDADLQGFLQLPNATPASKVKAAAAKLAKDEGTLVTELKKATWPAAAKPDITELQKTSSAERAVYLKCAAAANVTAIKTVLSQGKATIAARVAAASHVRVALGLPAAGSAATSSAPA